MTRYGQIWLDMPSYDQCLARYGQIYTQAQCASAARERVCASELSVRSVGRIQQAAKSETATCSSVQRHVPASLLIITRFLFTYQTGFKGGPKLKDFSHRFLHRFWRRFGLPFWIKNQVFFYDFLHQFPSFVFYVIIDVFWSVFGQYWPV